MKIQLLWARFLGNAKELSKGGEDRSVRHNLNTVIEGFTRGGETSLTHKNYAHYILAFNGIPIDVEAGESEALKFRITISKKDTAKIHPHNDDPMFIFI